MSGGFVLNRILVEVDSGKAGRIEGGAVGIAERPSGVRHDADHAEIGKWREGRAQHVGGSRRTEYIGASDPAGTRIEIEIRGQREMIPFRILGGAEVLTDVRLRTEQSVLFPGPQRQPHGA